MVVPTPKNLMCHWYSPNNYKSKVSSTFVIHAYKQWKKNMDCKNVVAMGMIIFKYFYNIRLF